MSEAPKPSKPHGPPLGWDAAAVADKARIGQDDISSARALWRRAVPKRLRKLLDARKR